MVIDLDRPAPPTARRTGRPGPRAIVAALVLMVAGAVIGGAVAYRWQEKQSDDARRSAVSLVMLPDVYERPDDAVSPLRAPGQQAISVVLARHVNLVNAGPAPVRLRSFQIDRTGLQLRGEPEATTDVTIPPGGSALAAIHATVRCNTDPLIQPQPVTVEIFSADGVRRQPTITFDGRAWAEGVEETCAQPWSRSPAGP